MSTALRVSGGEFNGTDVEDRLDNTTEESSLANDIATMLFRLRTFVTVTRGCYSIRNSLLTVMIESFFSKSSVYMEAVCAFSDSTKAELAAYQRFLYIYIYIFFLR